MNKEGLDNSQIKVSKTNKNKILIPVTVIMLLLLAGYCVGLYYYSHHFLYNTKINGIDVSNQGSIIASNLIDEKYVNYCLVIEGAINENGDLGEIANISSNDIDLKAIDTENLVTEKLKEQNIFAWTIAFFSGKKEFSINQNINFKKDMLKEVLNANEFFDESKMVNPTDAYIDDSMIDSEGYRIIKETFGTKIKENKALGTIEEAIINLQDRINLIENDCYEEATIKATSKTLINGTDLANKYLSSDIVYDWNGNKVEINKDLIKNWIDFDKYQPVLDEEAIADFVKDTAKEYDTYGKKRTFVTTSGIKKELRSGAYGWKTDKDAETNNLINYIKDGKCGNVEPVYSSEGYVKGNNDIGTSYVEIDMTNQHLYLYVNGSIVLESDFVSGNMSNGCGTPAGVFGITYKTKNATLKGDNYVTPVNYWMPFNGNIGMHDATWRSEFGGDIYLTKGSHGCINLPLDKAKEIYEYVEKKFPVICYY